MSQTRTQPSKQIEPHNRKKRALALAAKIVKSLLLQPEREPRRIIRLVHQTRSIELHHLKNLEHSDGMLVAFLPKERILFTADFNVPGPGQAVSPSIATLVQNLERLQLDFDRHVMVHAPNPDRPMTKADLLALAKGTN